MKFAHKHSRYYIRPLLLITAVLVAAVLVFLCVFAVVYQKTSAQLTRAAIADSTQALDMCAREVGSAFIREWILVTNGDFIARTRKSVSYADGRLNVPMNYSRMLALQKELNERYVNQDIFCDAAIVFLTDSKDFLCSRNVISDDFERDYANGNFRFGDMTYAEFCQALTSSADDKYMHLMTDARYLTYTYKGGYAANTGFFAYRYSDYNAEVQIYALLQINLDDLRKKFTSIHYAGDYFALAGKNEPIYTTDNQRGLSAQADGTYTDGASDTIYLSANIDKLSYACYISLNSDTIYAGIRNFTSILRMLFYAFVALSILLAILFFTSWHYPVIQIARQIPGEQEPNAIGKIDAHIASLEEQNSIYQSEIDQLSQPARDMLLNRLYAGDALAPEDAALIQKLTGIPPDSVMRCVCVGCLNRAYPADALIVRVSEAARADARLAAVTQMQGALTAVIMQTPEALDTAQATYDSLNGLLKRLNEYDMGVNLFAIGVSDSYIGYESVRTAYREAYTGWIDALTWQNSSVVHSDVSLSASNHYMVAYDQLESMYAALSGGDSQTAAMIFDKLVDQNFSPAREKHLKQLFCQQFYNDIIGVMIRLSAHYDIFPVLESMLSHGRNMPIFERLELMRETLLECIDLIPVKDAASDLSMQIQAYCKEQYMNPATSSLASVAEHFKISESNLSKFFKAHIGVNFSNYMENLRLRQAERLLIEENLSIRSIAEAVGYLNSTTFYYAFKRNHSCTPTQWLKQYKAVMKQKQ